MKRVFAASLIAVVALASCNQANVTGNSKTYTLTLRGDIQGFLRFSAELLQLAM